MVTSTILEAIPIPNQIVTSGPKATIGTELMMTNGGRSARSAGSQSTISNASTNPSTPPIPKPISASRTVVTASFHNCGAWEAPVRIISCGSGRTKLGRENANTAASQAVISSSMPNAGGHSRANQTATEELWTRDLPRVVCLSVVAAVTIPPATRQVGSEGAPQPGTGYHPQSRSGRSP